MMKTALAKIVTGKVAAVALATTAAAGGVAYAAQTGSLSSALGADNAKSRPAAAASAEAGREHGAKGSPSPSMVGLCHAFTAGAGDNPGKALENPAFTALITAAGGKDNVSAYCATVLVKPSHPAGKADSHPTGKPTSHPTGGKATHPGGTPSGMPTEAPTAAPTVKPTR
jgi:hypothetical protein